MTPSPRIALFYDVTGWAFHNVASNVARVSTGYDVSLYGRNDWFGRSSVVESIARQADILVFLWRFDLLAFLDCLDARAWRRFTSPDRPALVTVVYDHLYQNRASLLQMGNPFAVSDLVCVCSDRLQRVHEATPGLPPVFCKLPDGVDLSRFAPRHDVPAYTRPFRIGWVGNSRWADTLAPDLKGRRTVFDPAIEVLKSRGRTFETRIADASEHRIAHAQMPAFYHDLDILVCTSAMEGTPNPVLEAVASGVALVSTDVGIVPEVLGPLQHQFILKDRSPRAFADALDTLLSDPDLCAALCQENLARRDRLGWSTRAPLWKAMFETARIIRHQERGRATSAAIKGYRAQPRSGIERARRLVAMNPLAFRTYETLRLHAPGFIRQARWLLERGAR